VLGIDWQGEAYKVAESRHYPYGEERWSWTLEGTFTTDYRFTGQKIQSSLGSVYHMGARFYDSSLNRWLSADTLVPDSANPQSFNRYSYVRNSPLKFIDPTGHLEEADGGGCDGESCDAPDYLSDPAFWAWLEENGIYIEPTYDAWLHFCEVSFLLYNSPGGAQLWMEHTYDPDNYHPSVLAAEYWVDLNNAFWAGGALLTPPVGPIPMYLQTLDLRLGDSWSTSSWPKVQGQINAAGGLDAGNVFTVFDAVRKRGQQVQGRFPKNANPDEVLYRADTAGNITSYQIYDSQGNPVMRVDLQGKSHGGVRTPHTHMYQQHVAPNGTVYPKLSSPRPSFPWEKDIQ
jgi:RHS repeat-associated protein